MPLWGWALVAVAAVYALLVGALVAGGRGDLASAVARFVPDCVVLFRRLLADPGLPRRRKAVLVLLLGYLLLPIDVVPDFIPVAGYLDDAVIAALALRYVVRGADPRLLERHWPGPPETLALLERLSRRRPASPARR